MLRHFVKLTIRFIKQVSLKYFHCGVAQVAFVEFEETVKGICNALGNESSSVKEILF